MDLLFVDTSADTDRSAVEAAGTAAAVVSADSTGFGWGSIEWVQQIRVYC